MNRTHLLLGLFGLTVLVAAADVAWLYPQLPEQVATKFGSGGQPVAWSPRGAFLTLHLFSLGFVAVLILGLWLAMPWLPASLINLPHRDWWLAPERAEFTRRRLGNFVLGLGTLLLAYVTALGDLTMRANLSPPPRLGPALWVVTVLFLAGTLGMVSWLYLRFRRPG